MLPKPPTRVDLTWQRDLVFVGGPEARITLDSAGAAGPSPMQALGFALAACMSMDVVHILQKGRHELRGLRVALAAERAQAAPHRFRAVTLNFTVTGDVPQHAVDRAIQLSRDRYCSVWHSLREDIPLTVTSAVVPGVDGD